MTNLGKREIIRAMCNILNEGNIILVETKTSQETINKQNKFFDGNEWVD